MTKVRRQICVFLGIVLRDNKVLMTLRDEPECPDAHLKWELPGGKAELGEHPKKAVEREIFEETGVKVKTLEIIDYIQSTDWKYDWGTQHTILIGYLCKFVKEGKRQKDHHVKEVRWIEIDKVKDLDTLPGANEFLEKVSRGDKNKSTPSNARRF